MGSVRNFSSPVNGGGKNSVPKLRKHFWLWGGVIPAAVVGFDQLTKAWALAAFNKPANICALEMHPQAHIEIGPIFDLSLVCNRGVSFGLFSWAPEPARIVFTVFAAVMCCVLLYWLNKERGKLISLSLALIIGGAIGNASDRALHGAVTDFINFGDIYFRWVFNIADSAITCGVIGLLIVMFLQWRAEKSSENSQ